MILSSEELMHITETQLVAEFLNNQIFVNLKNKKILELGPNEGLFTEQICKHTDQITCIENDENNCNILERKFGNKISLIFDDFHERIKNVGYHDVVILYGILYHSPAPLYLLEQIVNSFAPQTILLECWAFKNESADNVVWDETPNSKGMRQSKLKTCNIVFNLPPTVYKKAIFNLGYDLVNEFVLSDYVETNLFKRNAVYMEFIKK